ncbi:MAG: LVIVD repeat-containing protein [Actinomycetota bacterium]
MRSLFRYYLVLMLLAVGLFAGGDDLRAQQAAENMSAVATFSYVRGTDIDFAGRYVYAAREGDEGGVYMFDVSKSRPREVAFVSCPGTQNDVAVVRPGLIALGFYSGACGGEEGSGVRLIDVSNPKRPRYLDSIAFTDGTHTLTTYPGGDYIYSSPGGLGENGGVEFILDVRNPRNIKIAAEYTPNPFGCHDVSFHATEGQVLGFCPGQAETEIWDASDPVSPVLLAMIPPHMEFPHSAVASPDGELLVIGDESIFTANECATGHSVTGALWAYDISDPTRPIPMGQISSPRGAAPVGTMVTPWCTAHNFNFLPKTRAVAVSWYTGGTSVIDFSDPTAPREVGYFRPDDADSWSSYFYKGLIYSNDQVRGLDVLRFDGDVLSG